MKIEKDELTIRDQFAMAVLPRLAYYWDNLNPTSLSSSAKIAKWSYILADAMMEERKPKETIKTEEISIEEIFDIDPIKDLNKLIKEVVDDFHQSIKGV